jgi:hypothetical protein
MLTCPACFLPPNPSVERYYLYPEHRSVLIFFRSQGMTKYRKNNVNDKKIGANAPI